MFDQTVLIEHHTLSIEEFDKDEVVGDEYHVLDLIIELGSDKVKFFRGILGP